MTVAIDPRPAEAGSRGDPLETLTAGGEVQAWKLDPAAPPLFLAPASPALAAPGALPAWLRRNRSVIDALLLEHGGIVFRGFSVVDTEDFNAVVGEFAPYSGNYQGGGAPRNKIAGQVYEASQIAGPLKIMLHQEMTYVARPPRRIIFFCRKPAERGGETIIGDMRRITRALPAGLREKLERLGVLTVRNFAPPPADGQEHAEDHGDQRSWQFAFYTADRAEVEAVCREKDFEAIWLKDGGLAVRSHLPAFADHPVTGERVYRTSLHSGNGRGMMTEDMPAEKRRRVEEMLARQEFRTGVYLGDGSELGEGELRLLNGLFAAAERSWAWQAGDVLLLDNLLTAHGRNPFVGTRDTQVALLD